MLTERSAWWKFLAPILIALQRERISQRGFSREDTSLFALRHIFPEASCHQASICQPAFRLLFKSGLREIRIHQRGREKRSKWLPSIILLNEDSNPVKIVLI